MNPALAVDSSGEVGFLYQQETPPETPPSRWETHLEILDASKNGLTDNYILASGDADVGVFLAPHLGDYIHLLSIGDIFYGIFSSANVPGLSHFPNGVFFQRNINAAGDTLLKSDGQPVPSSIDPFFFRIDRNPFDPCIAKEIPCFGILHMPPIYRLKVPEDGWAFTMLPEIYERPATEVTRSPVRRFEITGLRGKWRVEIYDSLGHRRPSAISPRGEHLLVRFDTEQVSENYFIGFSPIARPEADGYKIKITPLQ